MSTFLRLLVVVPGGAALLGLLLARRPLLARLVAVTGALVTLAAAGAAVVGHDDGDVRLSRLLPAVRLGVPGRDVGSLSIPFWQSSSGPVLLVALVVALVVACVQVYTTWYLRDDDRYGVFAATVSLFSAAMLLVVTSGDLVLTLVGWEVMGWCSYLLIGHWSRRESARRAAQKSFLVTRTADVGFVLGIVVLAAGAGSTSYAAVIGTWALPDTCVDVAAGAAGCTTGRSGLLTLGLVLLLVGVLGKSAMVPFHDWLPDAMEGPTPASALIHAATMVAAGTFVLAQLFDVLASDGPARTVLGVVTAVTMVWSAVLAFGQSDLKRLLAYSTVSQVAIMLSALAVAPFAEGPTAATLHLYAHAFFKALLFLLIGWMGILAGGTSAAALRGVARRSAFLRVSFAIGLLSLAGVPFLVGGVSKEHVIGAAYAAAHAGDGTGAVVLSALLLTVVLTAAYATRAFVVVSAAPVGPAHADPGHPGHDRPPAAVVGVLVVLVAGTVLGGLVLFTDLLPSGPSTAWGLVGVTTMLIVIGGLLAAIGSVRGVVRPDRSPGRARVDPATRLVGSRMPLFDKGFGVDTAYRVLVARPVLAVARGVAHLDETVVDATARLCARAVAWSGRAGDRAHRAERPSTGLVWVALGAVVVGAVGVLGWR